MKAIIKAAGYSRVSTEEQGRLLDRAEAEKIYRAVLWPGFQIMSGRIRGGGMYWLCHRETENIPKTQSHAIAVQGFPEAIIVSYTLILLRWRCLGRCVWHGMLTGQKNYRTVNAVIVQVYERVAIPCIMRRV